MSSAAGIIARIMVRLLGKISSLRFLAWSFAKKTLKTLFSTKRFVFYLQLRSVSYILAYDVFRNSRPMTKKEANRPTEAELEILQVLWSEGPASVRQVNDVLNEVRPVGYTTTLKLMQIMLDKGLLVRDASRRTHIYRAAVAERDTRQSLLENLVEQAFRGSAMDLVLQALGSHRATPRELEEIKALIEQLEKKK